MGLYSKLVLPYLTDFAMRDKVATARRSQLVPGADGIVLEIGIGSGLNLKDLSTLRDQLTSLVRRCRTKRGRVHCPLIDALSQS
jgi:hypothetical protein